MVCEERSWCPKDSFVVPQINVLRSVVECLQRIMRIKLAFGIGCTVPIRWARNMMQVLCLHLCPKSESCMIASKNRRLCLCQNFSISITQMLPFMFLSKRKRPKSASKSACQVCVFLTFSHFSQWKPQSRRIVLLTALKKG